MLGMQSPGKPSLILDLSWARVREQAGVTGGEDPGPGVEGPLTWSGARAQAPAHDTGP